ncbi:MAG: acyltransferase family protein, partial [Oscillospiraceae bacterium]|nr:acyltransferase family protein [Oscillospiraceae bacterium]
MKEPATPGVQPRVWFLDNAKALLIFLVVLGHAVDVTGVALKPGAAVLRVWIYMFHMPLFIFLAGYFSKRMLRPGQAFPKQRAFGFLLLFTALQVVNFGLDQLVFRYVVPGFTPAPMRFLTVNGAPWYLLGMLWWLLFTHLLFSLRPQLKPWLALLLAVAAGVAIGYDQQPQDFLAFPRAVFFYPFFLAGVFWKPEWFRTLRKWPLRCAAALCLGASLFLLTRRWQEAYDLRGMLSGRNNYDVF